ncbi:GIY-YIG nuclease family protein (plasmid) [Streptomyces sp. GDS52]|uniref:GIY-YIG nuclease family protein n=1 Tax=Streptomyces sp. GDS52 TaxID=3406419 RepID=UPI003FD33117
MIYVISLDDSQVVKIGRGSDPEKRVAQLQIGSPAPLILQWVHEGGEELENHLHAVFQEYRLRGEWFDLTPLGGAVAAVREAVEAADGAQLQKPRRFRGPKVVHPAASASTMQPAPTVTPLEEGQTWEERFTPFRFEEGKTWEELFPPVSPTVTWDERFPPGRSTAAAEGEPLRRTAEGEPVRPGCIRAWQGRCRRPAGTTCDC